MRFRCDSIVTVIIPRVANPCHITTSSYHAILWSTRPDRSMNFVTAVVSEEFVFIGVQLTRVKWNSGPPARADSIINSHAPASLLKLLLTFSRTSAQYFGHSSFSAGFSYHVSSEESVPTPECPIPSSDHRKGKRGKDFHFAASLRHHREPRDLQAWSAGTALSGMLSLLVVTFGLIVQLGSTWTYDRGWTSLFLLATAYRDRDDRDYSVANIPLMTNSCSITMMVIFSTTPADSRLVVRMSWRPCKNSFSESRARGD